MWSSTVIVGISAGASFIAASFSFLADPAIVVCAAVCATLFAASVSPAVISVPVKSLLPNPHNPGNIPQFFQQNLHRH